MNKSPLLNYLIFLYYVSLANNRKVARIMDTIVYRKEYNFMELEQEIFFLIADMTLIQNNKGSEELTHLQ